SDQHTRSPVIYTDAPAISNSIHATVSDGGSVGHSCVHRVHITGWHRRITHYCSKDRTVCTADGKRTHRAARQPACSVFSDAAGLFHVCKIQNQEITGHRLHIRDFITDTHDGSAQLLCPSPDVRPDYRPY